MRLSIFDCLRRGCVNLGANWELVLVNMAGNLVVSLLVVLGLLPPVLVLGFELFRGGLARAEGAEQVERFLSDLMRRMGEAPLPLLLAVAGTLAIWLLAIVVFCFVQAGTFGVLIAGERQALPGAARDRRWFRTFSLHNFSGWGGRYLWRFVRFFALAVLLAIALAGLAGLLIAGTTYGAARWGRGAAFGIGCGGALPTVFLVLLYWIWSRTAQADLAREGSAVLRASRLALEVIGRRLGAVILLLVLLCAAWAVLFFAFFPTSLALNVALADRSLASGIARLSLSVLQWVPAALLNLALAGTLAALVRSETPRSEARA